MAANRLPGITLRLMTDVLGTEYVRIESTDPYEDRAPVEMTLWSSEITVEDLRRPRRPRTTETDPETDPETA